MEKKDVLYSDSVLVYLVNSLVFIISTLIFLFHKLYLGALLPIGGGLLVLYLSSRIFIYADRIETKYIFRKSKKYQFNEIESVSFQRGRYETHFIIKLKDQEKNLVMDESNRPILTRILNHFHEKGIKVLKNEYWPNRIEFIDGKFRCDKIHMRF